MIQVWAAIVAGCFMLGAYLSWREHRRDASNHRTQPGWVYFLTPEGGAVSDPPAPIKIGMTHRDPYEERLPEIETMSPKPLEILLVVQASDPAQLERAIHKELAGSRLHGEWFDRQAVLAFLDAVSPTW